MEEIVTLAAYVHYVERIGKPPGPMLDDYAALIAAGAVHVLDAEHGRDRSDPRSCRAGEIRSSAARQRRGTARTGKGAGSGASSSPLPKTRREGWAMANCGSTRT